MKLSSDIISKISTITSTAQLVGINSVVIDNELIRGVDDQKQVLVFHSEDLNLPFGTIALNQLPVFASRLEIAQSAENFEVDAEVDGDFAKSLVMKGKKIKVDFRCANPAVIKVPKQIQDTMRWSVDVAAADVATLAKAASAMGSDVITIAADGETAKFEMTDLNRDTFTLDISGSVTLEKGVKGELKFSNKYPAKILLILLKKTGGNCVFKIGQGGMLNIVVNGINLFILPQV